MIYYSWLLDKIESEEHSFCDYGWVLRELYYTEFYWPETVHFDQNRASNGLYLRSMFVEEGGQDDGAAMHLDGKCSMLEMMIALSMDMDHLMQGLLSEENMVPDFFWSMMDNLELTRVTNIWVDTDPIDAQAFFDEKYERFSLRKIEDNGYGGLFLLKHPYENAANHDLWWLANIWLRDQFGDQMLQF